MSAGTPHRTLLGAARSEATRLRRFSFAGTGVGLVILFTLVGTAVAFIAAEGFADGAVPPPGMGAIVHPASERGLLAGLPMSANLIGVLTLSLWASAAASDYATGWIRLMVQAEPRRWRLLLAKFLVLAGFTAFGTLLATLIGVGAAPLFADVTGASTERWTSSVAPRAWLDLTLAMLVWGSAGFAIATATRSAVAAVGGGSGYLMVFEGVLRLAAEDLTTYLPGAVLSAVVAGGTDDLTYALALALAVGYLVIAMGVAVFVFHRRDITD